MQPARMQMQLRIVSSLGDPSGDAPHRFVAEISCLQRFDKEGGLDPEFGKTVEQKPQPFFLFSNPPQYNRLGDRCQCRVLEISPYAAANVELRQLTRASAGTN